MLSVSASFGEILFNFMLILSQYHDYLFIDITLRNRIYVVFVYSCEYYIV